MSNFAAERICFYSSMYSGRSSAREIIECAARYGVAGVELMSFCDELKTPDLGAARELGAIARSNNLALPCFSVGINLTGDDRNEAIERLRRYAEICAELGIPYLHHTICGTLSYPSIANRIDELFRIGVEQALLIGEYAEALGVKTLVEDQGFVFNGVDMFGKFLAATNEKIGVVLDYGNVMFVDERVEDFYEKYHSHVCHVHVKDYKIFNTPPTEMQKTPYVTKGGNYLVPVPFGKGDVDFGRIGASLVRHGYDGYLALEFERVGDISEVASGIDAVCSSFLI